MNIKKAKEILKNQFGFDSFRLNQKAAIKTVLEGKDTVVLMPTGGGKSLCYQIPALMQDGLTLVVSPLIALMKDQVDALVSNRVGAAFLNSTQTTREQVEVFQGVRGGKIKLLYVAPERLMQSGEQFINFLEGLNISLFAIDEAHCISSWGHDFRPEYRQLSKLKEYFPQVPIIALTATADKLVRGDIIKYLGLESYELLVSSFNRPNIYYTVKEKRNSYAKLLDFLEEKRNDSGIIYCLSRASTESLAGDLKDEGFRALPYHAGLTKKERDQHQNLFINDEVKIIVATIAFGMGIDKSNVRFVVHMDLPKNVESYYQETGRAGRDGLESEALLFFSWSDVVKLQSLSRVRNNRRQTNILRKKLNQMGDYGEMKTCRRRFLLNYFDEESTDDCGHCDNCNTEFEKFDGTIIAQKALSAIARTDQRFGAGYIIDFLRGSKSQKIKEYHKNLKTYGIGADLSKDEWSAYIKELISQGIIGQTQDQYTTLFLNDRSLDVLKGNEKVELFTVHKKEKKTKTLVSKVAHPYIEELFNELRTLRTEFARGEKLPPEVVFSDSTLVEFATYLPLTEADMRKMSGVGNIKWLRYGSSFLSVINDYCERNNLETRIKLKVHKQKKRTKTVGGAESCSISLEMFRQGKTIVDIASERNLSVRSIENHLIRYIPTGEVKPEDIVKKEKIKAIRTAFRKFDPAFGISPIKEFLGKDYSYGEIRAVISEKL